MSQYLKMMLIFLKKEILLPPPQKKVQTYCKKFHLFKVLAIASL